MVENSVSLEKMDEDRRALYISLRLAIKILISGVENQAREQWEDRVRENWNSPSLDNHLKRRMLIEVVIWMQEGKSDACMKRDCDTLGDLFARPAQEDWASVVQMKHCSDVVGFEDGGSSAVNPFTENSDLVSAALYEKYLHA
jgi:hypothetical protein